MLTSAIILILYGQEYLANDGKNKYINRFCIAGLITNVVLNYILIPIIDIKGAAIATLVTHIMIQIVMLYVYKDTKRNSITGCFKQRRKDMLLGPVQKIVCRH